MSYDPKLLFERISISLQENPCLLLRELSQRINVSERTIKNAVQSSTDRNFRCLRDEFLLMRVKEMFASEPGISIKELSFAIGFKSASAFARAIKRTSGSSPEELRSRVAQERDAPAGHSYPLANEANGRLAMHNQGKNS